MKLSTRSRYGIRMMYEFALNYGKGFIFLHDVAKRQDISEKYLGQLIIPLKSSVLVVSARGAHGGYSLARHPSLITLYEIINVLEGTSCVVDCVKEPNTCNRIEFCPTRSIWEKFDKTISDFLKGVTLESIVAEGGISGSWSMYYI